MLQPTKSSIGKKSRTAIAEANTIIKKFKLYVGDLKPDEVKVEHMVQLKDKMLESGSSPATINKGRLSSFGRSYSYIFAKCLPQSRHPLADRKSRPK